MAYWLRALVLPKDPGSTSSTHMAAHNSLYNSWGSDTLTNKYENIDVHKIS